MSSGDGTSNPAISTPNHPQHVFSFHHALMDLQDFLMNNINNIIVKKQYQISDEKTTDIRRNNIK